MKKCLIIRLSSLGDVALSSVLIDPLLEAGYKPYLLTFEPYHSLFEDDWRLTVIPTDREEVLSPKFTKKLREMNFELVLDIHANLRTFILKTFLRTKSITYRKQSLRRRLAVKFKRFRKPYSVVDRYLWVLKKLGIVKVNGTSRPRIIVSRERIEKVREMIGFENFIAIAPGARYQNKRYPKFGEVANELSKLGFEILWVGDNKDKMLVPEGMGVNLCGELSLPDLLAVLSLATAFIGNDSGPLHCARVVGTPAVQIYGATHPTLGFALGPHEGRVLIRGLPCQPCDVHGKGRCRFGDLRCLEIPPEAVVKEILSIVRVK